MLLKRLVASLVAPCMKDGLVSAMELIPEALASPFTIKLNDESLKWAAIAIAAYLMGIGIYFSTRRNYRRGEEMGDRGEILSRDIHPHKIALIEKGAKRLGLSSIHPAVQDASVCNPEWENAMDVVLADAAWSESAYGYAQCLEDSEWKYPSKELNTVILSTAEKNGKSLQTGPIHSSDVFYHENNASDKLQEMIDKDC